MSGLEEPLEAALFRNFGLSSFRTGQARVIEAVLSGRSTLAVMPTGQGKSLCYQLPALMLDGLTVVVSPLIALMKDQVDGLQARGIPATCINSSLDSDEMALRLQQLQRGEMRLVYVAPERFRQGAFLSVLKQLRVALFAVDEAHCLSQWGHDFRPDYLRLGEYVAACGNPVVLATTATATPEVREDIVTQLRLKNPEVVVSGFSRPNLKWVVRYTPTEDSKMAKLREVLDRVQGATVVYAATRKKVVAIHASLAKLGVSVVPYHAGMGDDERARAQDRFMSGEARVVVATNAFGMGVDKADVRAVVHVDLPGTMEAYYQEAGRAGRDGRLAFCVLLFSPADRYLQEFFIDGSSPAPSIIREVYDLVARQESFPFFMSVEDLARGLRRKTHPMAVGTALTLLERHGLIERTVQGMTRAWLQLKDWGASAPRSLTQQRIIEFCRTVPSVAQGVHIDPQAWSDRLEIPREVLQQALHALQQKNVIAYAGPSRTRGITLMRRVPDPLSIMDVTFLESKRERELQRLESVISYACSRRCRDEMILAYFGEVTRQVCGRCDCCQGRLDPGFDSESGAKTKPYVTHEHGSLHRVRAALARQAGVSDGALMSDGLLTAVAAAAPRSLAELRHVPGMDRSLVASYGPELLGGLMAAREPASEAGPSPAQLLEQEQSRIDRRRMRVAEFFIRGLDLDLIANRLMTARSTIEDDVRVLTQEGVLDAIAPVRI